MIKDPTAWSGFSTELSELASIQERYQDFEIFHVPRIQNKTVDSLAKTPRAFHRSLFFISCSIPIWISRPPLV
ncbi:hypothetical protein Bca4012_055930 [Brassica carinata]